MRGSVAEAFGADLQQLVVSCFQEDSSTSNSRIAGEVTATFAKDGFSQAVTKVIVKALDSATNSTLSELDITSYKVLDQSRKVGRGLAVGRV
jgi:hypothetical protein